MISRNFYIFTKNTVYVNSQNFHIAADIRPANPACIALPARKTIVDGYGVTHLDIGDSRTNLENLSGSFMTQNARISINLNLFKVET